MPFRILTAMLVTVAVLAVPSLASASYTMSKKAALSFARSDVTARYVDLNLGDDSNVSISCRPSKDKHLNPGHAGRYHRWVCDWESPTLSDKSCDGRVLIVGSAQDADNTYYRATLRGARCTA